MKGEVVGGFVVTDSLGSGRAGLLYLAVNPKTGERVVVQRLGSSDLRREFASDAHDALSLPHLPRVTEERTRGGLAVLVAHADDLDVGSGFSRYTKTERALPTPAKRSRWPVVVLLLCGCLALGVVGAWALFRTSEAPVVDMSNIAEPPVVEPRQRAVATPEPTLPVVEPPPVPARPAVKSSALPSCAPDEQWKSSRRADVQELLDRASASESLWARFEPTLARITKRVTAATSVADCRAVERDLASLNGQLPVP